MARLKFIWTNDFNRLLPHTNTNAFAAFLLSAYEIKSGWSGYPDGVGEKGIGCI